MQAIIRITLLVVITVVIYEIIKQISQDCIRKKVPFQIKNIKFYKKVENYIFTLKSKKIIKSKYFNTLAIIAIMALTGIGSFIIFNLIIKVNSTAIILCIPCSYFPILICKILINQERKRIIRALPMYVISLKNHISTDNSIVKAIQLTNAEPPLQQYIDSFKSNIIRGIDIIEAFNLLKKEVNVKEFEELINICEVCYLNGGDFSKVLEYYLSNITKENIQKETTKEKAYSSMLTLIIMLILNVFVIVSFVFANGEYARIIRETFTGNMILNFNAISYMLIAYFVSKIYKEE